MLRLALLAGVLVFGAVVYLQRRYGAVPAPIDSGALRLLGRVIWGVAVTGVGAVFLLVRNARSTAAVRIGAITAWALAEVTGLYGAVVYYSTGDAVFFVLGVLFMLFSFLALPGERR